VVYTDKGSIVERWFTGGRSLRRVFPQESIADSHSLISNGFQLGASGGSRRVQTSAAMLGIALSFGTSAPLLLEPESALAAEGSVVAVLPAAGSTAEFSRPVFVNNQGELAATTYHTVEEGDSLWHIAEEHEADLASIKSANGIAPDEVLQVGQVLRVPAVLDAAAVATLPGQVHRLALSNNVRGSVGGDLTVVFGEELPMGDSSQADELITSVAQLEAEASEAASYELGAAALSEGVVPLSQADGSLVTGLPDGEAMPEKTTVAALPVSMPLADVEASALDAAPLEAAAIPAAGVAPETVVTTVPGDDVAPGVELQGGGEVLPLETAGAWQDQGTELEPGVVSPQLETDKSLTIAALGDTPAVPEADVNNSVPGFNHRVYQVKAGDTFWNIASRHGLSLDELLSHNAGQRPETLAVGDRINIPADVVPVGGQAPATVARSGQLPQDPSREVAIQDHLARIRAAANREVDQEVLKARILAVRRSLEEPASVPTGADNPLEYHGQTRAQAPADPLTRATLTRPAASQGLPVATASSTRADWSVTDAANDGDAMEIAALTDSPGAVSTPAAPATAPEVAENLMAVAPMSPEVYRTSPQLPVGEVVTPGMPILPGSGEFLPDAPNRVNGYIWPAQGTLTSGYGWRWGRMHQGIDIAGPVGTPIMAAAPGVVVRSGWNSGGYGNLVDIRHSDGSLTRYAHNSRLLVREGQQVRQGEQIAEMGSTGYSTGPHLHFEVHLPNAGTVNPMAHLPGR
jgi:murein DD-endopeptidase MepM/ murein hydrolase activator NlpD